MSFLRSFLGMKSAKVQVHLAKYAGEEGAKWGQQVFVNIANTGIETFYVVRMTVAPTATDRIVELGWEKFPVYPGDAKEISIPMSSLGLTQVFNPKNFRVHLATGEVFKASVRTDVGQVGLVP
jgi:hypothetical protein